MDRCHNLGLCSERVVDVVGLRRTLYLVRHGQSEWNAEGRLQGQTAHVGLTELGERQARSAADRLAHCGAVEIVSSDLVRAAETAGTIAARVGVPLRVDPAWREQSLGVLEGKLREDAWSRVRGEHWSADWRPQGGESTRDVYRRIAGSLAGLATEALAGAVIMVTHGDTLRIALGLLDGAPPEAIPWIAVPNGGVVSRTIAETEAGIWRTVGS